MPLPAMTDFVFPLRRSGYAYAPVRSCDLGNIVMRPVLALAGAALLAFHVPAFAAEAAPAAAAPADAARIAAARRTVDFIFPLGTYARVMNGTMDKMMESLMDSTMQLPLKDLAGMAGADVGKTGSASLAEMMAIYDPAYKERMRISSRTMMTEMMGLMTEVEPDIREGLASAYAARFDTAQLEDLNAFFATPTGKVYAADSYLIMMSPEVIAKMQAFMPKFMKLMPSLVEKVQVATAKLPPMRKYADLSKAEKDKLAALIGISRKKLDETEAAKAGARPE